MRVTDWLTVAVDADAGGGDCCSGTSWFRGFFSLCVGVACTSQDSLDQKSKKRERLKAVCETEVCAAAAASTD